jgi:hypothetical protein
VSFRGFAMRLLVGCRAGGNWPRFGWWGRGRLVLGGRRAVAGAALFVPLLPVLAVTQLIEMTTPMIDDATHHEYPAPSGNPFCLIVRLISLRSTRPTLRASWS